MTMNLRARRARIVAGAVGVSLIASGAAAYLGRYELREEYLKFQWRDRGYNAAVMEKALMIAGGNPAEAQNESREAVTIAEQFEQARTAPTGIVAPGAYAGAYSSIIDLASTSGTWAEVTKVPYNADDPRYRDWNSNSSGGAGHVSGRITGLAADTSGTVYAAGADGGVWRTTNGYGDAAHAAWTPIADALPSLSSGDLQLASDGSLWFATGEANTGATSYVGAGVYRLANPATGAFAPTDRVGGTELDSAAIGRVRPGQGVMFAATNRGVYFHDASSTSGAWTFAFAPNPDYLPGGAKCLDALKCGATSAAYKNIVNDIAVDPKDPKHVIAAIGWRSGDTYNGFYETKDYTKGPGSWQKLSVVLGGITNSTDIGYTTFAFSKTGDRLYAVVQQPSKIAGASNLAGIFVSKTGSPLGPWNQIANHMQLLASGSALDKKGYSVGVQAWYNQFLTVDPKNPDHVWAGLEEVFETKDAGSHWTATSPYWNFGFKCWNLDDSKNSCPLAGHPDQHSVAVSGDYVYFGNDGGVYRNPVNGKVDANGNSTELASMSADGTLGALQYYSVSVGKDTTTNSGVVVSGGLQDNGVSNLFGVQPGGTNADPGTSGIFSMYATTKNPSAAGTMGSNFGGDGGDGAADPRNGCNQLQEYVNLAVKVTNNCALNKGANSEAESKSWSIDPGDPAPRFIAPVALDASNPDLFIMGGRKVYLLNQTDTVTSIWQARSAADVKAVTDLGTDPATGASHSATAVAMTKGVAYAAWCGPCNNAGFSRGVSTNAGGTWHPLALTGIPNRFISGVGVDPANGQHAYLAVNGFSRRWTEGPGVGVGHVFETTDGGANWTDISGDLPDVPANSVKQLSNGALAVGTDLGAFYRAPGASSWKKLGTGLPLTVVMDVEEGSDGLIYVATHGRGIWSIAKP